MLAIIIRSLWPLSTLILTLQKVRNLIRIGGLKGAISSLVRKLSNQQRVEQEAYSPTWKIAYLRGIAREAETISEQAAVFIHIRITHPEQIFILADRLGILDCNLIFNICHCSSEKKPPKAFYVESLSGRPSRVDVDICDEDCKENSLVAMNQSFSSCRDDKLVNVTFVDFQKMAEVDNSWLYRELFELEHPREEADSGIVGLIRKVVASDSLAFVIPNNSEFNSYGFDRGTKSSTTTPFIERSILKTGLGSFTVLALQEFFGRSTEGLESSQFSKRFEIIAIKSVLESDRKYQPFPWGQVDYSVNGPKKNIDILAYYLPQFHPNPLNDEWHGQGFTEWTNVKSSQPQFSGHYQQRQPVEKLGYYSLENSETLREQAAMMKKSGVEALIFYHYWFTGQQILNDVMENLLAMSDINMKYCVCWANENWTKRWDGNEQEVLLRQDYSDEDAKSFIEYLIPFLKDARYYRVGDRPVIFIYRPDLIVGVERYLAIWEAVCKENGLKKPYVIATLTRGAKNPEEYFMDAGVERPLHDWVDFQLSDPISPSIKYNPDKTKVLEYSDVVNHYISETNRPNLGVPVIPSVLPSWDNTARYGSGAYVVNGNTPELFQKWLHAVTETSPILPGHSNRLIVVNAWNEWAEGAYLEPDQIFGFGNLNAVGKTVFCHNESSILQPEGKKILIKIRLSAALESQIENDWQNYQHFYQSILNSKISENVHIFGFRDPMSHLGLDIEECSNIDQVLHLEVNRFSIVANHTLNNLIEAFFQDLGPVSSNGYGQFQLTDHSGDLDLERQEEKHIVLKGGHEGPSRTIHNAPSFALDVPIPQEDKAEISVVIRFHKGGNFQELRNCLLSLAASNSVIVQPIFCLQDLTNEQLLELGDICRSIPWGLTKNEIFLQFCTKGGASDLRSRMLHQGLRAAKTRYVAFLDFDDLIHCDAYRFLIREMTIRNKAIGLGRIWSTDINTARNEILSRRRDFEYGSSFKDFVVNNFAPIHSFVFDLDKLDISHLVYVENQKYMEDYFMTLQLFTPENVTWDLVESNIYVGDYMHAIDRENTLANKGDTKSNIHLDAKYIEDLESIKTLQRKIIKKFKVFD